MPLFISHLKKAETQMAQTQATIEQLPGFIHPYRMVSSDLIIQALHKQDDTKEYTEDDFRTIRTLILAGQNICTISNMADFSMLIKLDVSNNALERLDGLQFLKNLEVLDASFNKLTSVEGIEKLVRLTDLTLNNNRIQKLSPLVELSNTYKDFLGIQTSSHPLASVNLANNEISDLAETLSILKRFVNIKILVLQNNPVTSAQSYRAQTTVYLKNLRYLDFAVVRAAERAKYAENFTTEITQRKDQETSDNARTAKALAKAKQLRLDAAADCPDFDNIVSSELVVGEQNEKIFLIPAIRNEAVANFVPDVTQLFKNLARTLRRLRVLREGEICEYEEFYDVIINDLQGQEDMAVQDYYIEKDKLWVKYNDVLKGNLCLNDIQDIYRPKTVQKQINLNDKTNQGGSAEGTRKPGTEAAGAPEGEGAAAEGENAAEAGERLDQPDRPAAEEAEEAEEKEKLNAAAGAEEAEEGEEKEEKDAGEEQGEQEQKPRRPRTKPLLKPSLKAQKEMESSAESGKSVEKEQEVEPLRCGDLGDAGAVEDAKRRAVEHLRGKMSSNLQKLIKKLVSLETEVQNEVYSAIEQLQGFFNNVYKKRVEDVQPFFQAIRDACERFHSVALDLLMKAVDKKMRKEAESANAGANVAGADDLIMENQQFANQGVESAAANAGVVQEVQNLLPADITPEVLALLKDRDTAKSANMLAWDYKLQIIEAKDTAINQSTNEFIGAALGAINGVEQSRARKRQNEIAEFEQREQEWIQKVVFM